MQWHQPSVRLPPRTPLLPQSGRWIDQRLMKTAWGKKLSFSWGDRGSEQITELEPLLSANNLTSAYSTHWSGEILGLPDDAWPRPQQPEPGLYGLMRGFYLFARQELHPAWLARLTLLHVARLHSWASYVSHAGGEKPARVRSGSAAPGSGILLPWVTSPAPRPPRSLYLQRLRNETGWHVSGYRGG